MTYEINVIYYLDELYFSKAVHDSGSYFLTVSHSRGVAWIPDLST